MSTIANNAANTPVSQILTRGRKECHSHTSRPSVLFILVHLVCLVYLVSWFVERNKSDKQDEQALSYSWLPLSGVAPVPLVAPFSPSAPQTRRTKQNRPDRPDRPDKPDQPDKPKKQAPPLGSPSPYAAGLGSVAPAFTRQQSLYFLPLPQGQGALRPTPWRRRGTNGSSDSVSW